MHVGGAAMYMGGTLMHMGVELLCTWVELLCKWGWSSMHKLFCISNSNPNNKQLNKLYTQISDMYTRVYTAVHVHHSRKKRNNNP